MPQSRVMAAGDVVVLWTSDNRVRTVRVHPHEVYASHLGEFPLSKLIGQEYGARFELARGWGLALPPALEDRLHLVRRNTNVLYPKDIGLILMKMVIGPGSRVVEIGTGSGALTVALAAAVSPGGTVHTFDVREDFWRAAQKNFQRAGIGGHVEFRLREPKTPLPVEPVDCVVMDIPEPWEEMDVVDAVLRKGGRLASMNPTYNQIESMAEAMRGKGYILIECVEMLFRRVVVAAGRVRPARVAIPHTEFLLFGVKSGEAIPEGVDPYYVEG